MAVGLGLAFVSAVVVNWAYSREHDAAAAMPRFSLRQPFPGRLARHEQLAVATAFAGLVLLALSIGKERSS